MLKSKFIVQHTMRIKSFLSVFKISIIHLHEDQYSLSSLSLRTHRAPNQLVKTRERERESEKSERLWHFRVLPCFGFAQPIGVSRIRGSKFSREVFPGEVASESASIYTSTSEATSRDRAHPQAFTANYFARERNKGGFNISFACIVGFGYRHGYGFSQLWIALLFLYVFVV